MISRGRLVVAKCGRLQEVGRRRSPNRLRAHLIRFGRSGGSTPLPWAARSSSGWIWPASGMPLPPCWRAVLNPESSWPCPLRMDPRFGHGQRNSWTSPAVPRTKSSSALSYSCAVADARARIGAEAEALGAGATGQRLKPFLASGPFFFSHFHLSGQYIVEGSAAGADIARSEKPNKLMRAVHCKQRRKGQASDEERVTRRLAAVGPRTRT
jgi:hypothetical protein